MESVTIPLFGDRGTETDLEPAAGVAGEAWAARQFRGHNMRIRSNRTVHRVTFLLDERGVEVPAPQCHVGSFAAGRPWWKVYAPTLEEVSCGSCLTGHRSHRQPAGDCPQPSQLALDLDLDLDEYLT